MTHDETLEKLNQYRAAFILLAHDYAFPYMLEERRERMEANVEKHGICPTLFVQNDGESESEELTSISLLCSDTFGYACADSEDVPLAECPALVAILQKEGWPGLIRWILARRAARGEHETVIRPVQEAMDRIDAEKKP